MADTKRTTTGSSDSSSTRSTTRPSLKGVSRRRWVWDEEKKLGNTIFRERVKRYFHLGIRYPRGIEYIKKHFPGHTLAAVRARLNNYLKNNDEPKV